jgi:hypothetical protein
MCECGLIHHFYLRKNKPLEITNFYFCHMLNLAPYIKGRQGFSQLEAILDLTLGTKMRFQPNCVFK